MGTTFTIVRGSAQPMLSVYLTVSDGSAFDLTTATEVRLAVAKEFQTESAELLLDVEMDVSGSPTSGLVTYAFDAEETTQTPRRYHATVEVTLPSGVVRFPVFDFVISNAARS